MNFRFSRERLSGKDRLLERALEWIPGLLSWSTLIVMAALAFLKPIPAAIIIIAFDLYWLLRLFYMTIFLLLSYLRLAMENKTDWLKRAKELHGEQYPDLNVIHHLVIYPIANESTHIVEPAIKSLTTSQFPAERLLVVLAVEDRAEEKIKMGAEEIRKKYQSHFRELLVVFHPDGLPGEARVKGANVTYAAKKVVERLGTLGISTENVIVSCFDADTVVRPDYFSCLTYHFMATPDRHQASYQPIPVYHNNIWNVPGFARVLSIGSSFFQLIEATNPEQLVTFSSHSMSLKALMEVDYWPVDMISDDSAIFWKALLHYNGNYRAVPMYITLSMHVPESGTPWKTIKNVYKQQRRWAWGVENFPIVTRGFIQNKSIPVYLKIKHGFKLLGNHVSWATWAFLLTIIGWLPALFAGREFSDTVLYYSAPRITTTIFNLSSLALITTIILSLLLLPKRETHRPLAAFKRIFVALEWLMIPVICIFLGALPALDAQTRLMLGRYMEFWVTDKERLKKNK